MKRGTDNSLVLVSMLLVSLMMLSVSMPNANAASVGPNSPGTVVSVSPGDHPWSNPDNAKAADDSYASAAAPPDPPSSSYRLKATNYGFSIPSGATVRGIQVDVERHKDSQDYSRVKDMEILIVKSDGSLGTSNKADTATNWPQSDATKSYGGATDSWGEVWSPADIDDSNFGVVVRVSFSWDGSYGGTPTVTAYVDYVSITVYFDPAPTASVATATGTGSATFSTSAGGFASLTAVAEGSIPSEGKPNLQFPHGFFSFTIAGITPGATVTVTITLPSVVPVGIQYWKYGPTPDNQANHWYEVPIGDDNGDNVITITITDNGLGDDRLTGEGDGQIVDQGGPGVPVVPKAPTTTPAYVAIPEYPLGLVLLALLIPVVYGVIKRKARPPATRISTRES